MKIALLLLWQIAEHLKSGHSIPDNDPTLVDEVTCLVEEGLWTSRWLSALVITVEHPTNSPQYD